jgi:hypothetical protein
MPDDRSDSEGLDDFAGAMQLLASQAAAKTTSGGSTRGERSEILLQVGQMIRPLAKELEDLRLKSAEQSMMLTALGKHINAQNAVPAALEGIREEMVRLGSVESANQKLFDALHAELKGYKDNFLFDALQKPFVRDLVSLFDDLREVHSAMLRRLEDATRTARDAGTDGEPASEEVGFLKMSAGNVENQIHHMIEVFLRMDVTISETRSGAPLDKKAHRVISVEPAAQQSDDGLVQRSIRPGFFWRDRLIRPEEVVVRRWTAPASPHAAPPRATALTPNAALPPATRLVQDGDVTSSSHSVSPP